MRTSRIAAAACAALITVALTGALPAGASQSTVSTTAQDALTTESVPTPMVSGPVTGGRLGIPFTSSPVPLGPAGYTEQEYFVGGTATGYQQAGTWGSDGRWSITPAEQAAYKTRILVRRPADPARFNGTVVVEWLNVSTGVDVDPDYLYDNAELLREGYAWVGVSAQAAGVGALRQIDPARYASLTDPGDTFSYSIFSQVAQALRNPAGAGVDALGGLRPRALIADGESQSALRMSTYVDAVQPVDHEFDGFVVHSRSAGVAPISQAPQVDQEGPPIAYTRTDRSVPVLTVQTETDLLAAPPQYYPATQPDSAAFRLWEIAGASHEDQTLLSLGNAEVAPFVPNLPPLPCALPANDGQQRYVMDDALAQLNRWVRLRLPAEHAPRIDVSTASGTPVIVRDAHGNALGGIRTPAVQVPISTESGYGNSGPSFQCALLGTRTPFTPAQLAAAYPVHADYVARVAGTAAVDAASGFLLPVDAAAIVRTAADAPVPSGS